MNLFKNRNQEYYVECLFLLVSSVFVCSFVCTLTCFCTGEEYAVTLQESAYLLHHHHHPNHHHHHPNHDIDHANIQKLAQGTSRFLFDPDTYTDTYTDSDSDTADTDTDLAKKCQPRQIHLSLGSTHTPQQQSHPHENSQDSEQGASSSRKTSMTVSFSIPYRMDSSCHPSNIQIRIQYGIENANGIENDKRKMWNDTIINGNGEDELDEEGVHVVMRQYVTVCPVTGETYQSDFIYHVTLDDLEGSTDYWYSISVLGVIVPVTMEEKRRLRNSRHFNEHEHEHEHEHGDTDPVSDPFRPMYGHEIAKTDPVVFRTAPSVSAKHAPVKFAIAGDLGQTYNSTITMLNILASTHTHTHATTSTSTSQTTQTTPVTALLIAGDMSYANSIQPQWDNWFNLIQPIAQKIPLMVAAGNHEIECDKVTHMPFMAYENRFFMPNRVGDAVIGAVGSDYWNVSKWGCATPSVFLGTYDYGNAFYSFDYGLVKTIVLSSYSDTRRGSNQYNWLLNELKHIDRRATPWLVVMMHTQFYTTFKGHNEEEETVVMREAMEGLFREYQVNLVFSGHDHAYMRSLPMFHGKVDASGKSPIYMIVGEGGNRESHVKNYVHEDPEDWVGVRDKSVYGFGTMEFVNETHANWKWIMDGNTGEKFEDDVWFEHQYLQKI